MEAECWNNNCMLELSKKKEFDFDKSYTNLFTTIKIHETIPHWREEGIAGQHCLEFHLTAHLSI